MAVTPKSSRGRLLELRWLFTSDSKWKALIGSIVVFKEGIQWLEVGSRAGRFDCA